MDAFQLISALLSMLSVLKLSCTSTVSNGLFKYISNSCGYGSEESFGDTEPT